MLTCYFEHVVCVCTLCQNHFAPIRHSRASNSLTHDTLVIFPEEMAIISKKCAVTQKCDPFLNVRSFETLCVQCITCQTVQSAVKVVESVGASRVKANLRKYVINNRTCMISV